MLTSFCFAFALSGSVQAPTLAQEHAAAKATVVAFLRSGGLDSLKEQAEGILTAETHCKVDGERKLILTGPSFFRATLIRHSNRICELRFQNEASIQSGGFSAAILEEAVQSLLGHFAGDPILYEIGRSFQSDQGRSTTFLIKVQPNSPNAIFAYTGVHMTFNNQTGRLLSLRNTDSFLNWNIDDRLLKPMASEEQLFATALSAFFGYRPFPDAIVVERVLSYGVPKFQELPNLMTAAHFERAQAKNPQILFRVLIGQGGMANTNADAQIQMVWVDALTNECIAIQDLGAKSFSGEKGRSRAWSASQNAKSWSVLLANGKWLQTQLVKKGRISLRSKACLVKSDHGMYSKACFDETRKVIALEIGSNVVFLSIGNDSPQKIRELKPFALTDPRIEPGRG